MPRTAAEIEEIALLVKSTIGFNEVRGDLVEVRNLPFENAAATSNQKTLEQMIETERYERYALYGALAIALLLGYFVIRKILNSSIENWMVVPEALTSAGSAGQPGNALPGQEAAGNNPQLSSGMSDLYLKKLSPEAREKIQLQDSMTEEISQFVDASPEKTAQLVRGWLVEANAGPKAETT